MEILWLGHLDCHDASRAGAKAANLSRLLSSYHIPPGFCITAAAYAQWAALTGSERLALPPQAIPPALYNDIASAYRGLAALCGVADPSVAVRSSAVDEDGTMRSFAGQYETYLNIVGIDAVAEAVVRCWASGHTARALAYRRGQDLAAAAVCLAVLVQQLVPAQEGMGLGQMIRIRRCAHGEGGLFVIRPVFRRRQRGFQCPNITHPMQPPKLLNGPCLNSEHFIGTEEKQSHPLYSGPCASSV